MCIRDSYNDVKIRRLSATPGQITALGITTPIFDINEQTRLEHGQPRDKVAIGANWKIGAITFDVRGTRYGRVEQVALTNQTAANVALIAQQSTPLSIIHI